jgi:hypothetical protein
VVRGLDLRLPSNLFVLGGFFVAAAGMAVFRLVTNDAGDALRDGLQAGFSVLLSWAMARELDPDRASSATVAAPVGFLVFLSGSTNLGAVTALLFALRVTGDTPGVAPTVLDLVWLPGLAAYAARVAGGVPAAAALAGGLIWDGLRRRRPAEVVVGCAAAAGALAVGVFRHTLAPAFASPSVVQWAILVAGGAGAVVTLRLRAPNAAGDRSHRRLDADRVRVARGLAVATGVATVAWIGGPAAQALVGLWAALIGVGVARSVGRS